ncbi:hypothetical protein [Sporomusa acidovorans]|uniref:hypothetical protein n=1 Tax=Sporomusa acidovorans TaxID=112900 RepID=UPI001FE1691A|nr:hypothetical protein [Sporomusa acidovorans]
MGHGRADDSQDIADISGGKGSEHDELGRGGVDEEGQFVFGAARLFQQGFADGPCGNNMKAAV